MTDALKQIWVHDDREESGFFDVYTSRTIADGVPVPEYILKEAADRERNAAVAAALMRAADEVMQIQNRVSALDTHEGGKTDAAIAIRAMIDEPGRAALDAMLAEKDAEIERLRRALDGMITLYNCEADFAAHETEAGAEALAALKAKSGENDD